MQPKTLRDEFAMAALHAMLIGGVRLKGADETPAGLAESAYIYARCMLAEREKYDEK